MLLLVVAAVAGVLVLSGAGTSSTTRSGGDKAAHRAPASRAVATRPPSTTTTQPTTTTTTAPPTPVNWRTNPTPPTPRPDDGTRPTVVYFGDSMSVNAAPEIKEQLTAAGYDLVYFSAFIGASMCKDEMLISQAISDYQPQILVLQYEGNGALFDCVDGYQPTYDLYSRATDGIGLNATYHGPPGGTKVVLVSPVPHADGRPLFDGSVALTDLYRAQATAKPNTFIDIDATTGLVPGPGALMACYPQEPGCRLDGLIQVRPDSYNPYDGTTVVGDGSHFCTDSTLINLGEEDCNVPNAGGLRFAYNIVDGLRAAGL